MLRLSVSIAADRLRVLIPALLFELSDNAPQLLMRNVGYGYAAGFLHVLGVPLTSGISSANVSNDVNPMTGQWRDAENAEDDVPETTDKEKDREAQRLFVLFQRLEANGIIRAENPVGEASREGRFRGHQ
ncbi:hypothetical protein SI65_04663 [Aspergillus cristatus]|uniref:Uncharacterized protein n=1 Tax=Aspergillus cristatus TaxID=573508 RepID=A0A1E3BFL0_ASPCR|nr:hypothetical protein SI65_04663 [Aspergillus cristatus]